MQRYKNLCFQSGFVFGMSGIFLLTIGFLLAFLGKMNSALARSFWMTSFSIFGVACLLLGLGDLFGKKASKFRVVFTFATAGFCFALVWVIFTN